MQARGVFRRQGGKRIEQEGKALVAAHIAQIGQSQGLFFADRARQIARRAARPAIGMIRADAACGDRCHSEAQRQTAGPFRYGQHQIAMAVDQIDNAAPTPLQERIFLALRARMAGLAAPQPFQRAPARLHQRQPEMSMQARARPRPQPGKPGLDRIDRPDSVRLRCDRQATRAGTALIMVAAVRLFPLPEIHLRAKRMVIVQAEHEAGCGKARAQRKHPGGQSFKRMKMHDIIGSALGQEIRKSRFGRPIR